MTIEADTFEAIRCLSSTDVFELIYASCMGAKNNFDLSTNMIRRTEVAGIMITCGQAMLKECGLKVDVKVSDPHGNSVDI